MIELSALIPLSAAAIVNILDAIRKFHCTKCCGAECVVDDKDFIVDEKKQN